MRGARRAVKSIGYGQDGFHWEKTHVSVYVHKQSVDIAQGVDAGASKDEGADDQIMFGYACGDRFFDASSDFYSHRILEELAKARHSGDVKGLGPDSKSQVTLEYEDGEPVRAKSIVVSTQHSEE